MKGETLTVREMRERLGISKNTAYALVSKSDFFPAYRIGKKVCVDAEQLEKWIQEQGRKKDDETEGS